MEGYFIKEKDPKKRIELIDFLESKGYALDPDESRSRQEIETGTLPIVVDDAEKVYRMMGNVTAAAAAAGSGKVITVDEFYQKMGISEKAAENG